MSTGLVPESPGRDLSRAQRSELLASAPMQPLLDLADACVADAPRPDLISGPEVGTVLLTVREPVEASRFYLGDVLVTRTMVEHRDVRGWSMRMGDDRPGSLAAAICDAEVEAGGPHAFAVEALCRAVDDDARAARAAEWRQLEGTVVRFEEMGE